MGKGGSQVFLTFLGSSVLKQWSLPLLHCMRSEREREGEMYLHFSYTLIQIFVLFTVFHSACSAVVGVPSPGYLSYCTVNSSLFKIWCTRNKMS